MDFHSQQRSSTQDRVSLRPMRRVDRTVVFSDAFVRWETVELNCEIAGDEHSSNNEFIELVVERNCQIVGWMRAARTSLRSDFAGIQANHTLKKAWWMQPTSGWNNGAGLQLSHQGDILLGTGAGILARITDSPAEHARILTLMYEFGRSQLVRRLGVSRWVAQIPLAEPTAWQDVYSSAGYVQQVEAGAIEDRLLSIHLRQNARVLEVCEHQTNVWVVWENPMR